ncbi:MAG: glucose-1-phosphate adenylyltransferase [Saprospiraceae bacterium]|nr:glucose-1-phosphate adenylyltransferase [Saprospiraceae bacterium]
MIKMVSLILGGGSGSRLYPLTSQRSKPAVPVGGKYRLIDIPISNCLNSGVKRMFVLTQFNSASLNKHIKNTFNFDMFSHGFVDILAAEQTPTSDKWFQGTADAVRQSMHHLNNHDHDYVLILSGDQLYQMNFEDLAKYHIKQKADLTIATIPVIDRDAPGFGIMKVNEKGFIENFVEKPPLETLGEWQSAVPESYAKDGKLYLASMGIYLFKRKFLKKLFDDNPEATDFGKEIIPHAIEQGYKVASYSFDDYWTDIGTIRSFFEANIALTDDIPKFDLFNSTKQIYTRPRLLGPSKIFGTWFNKSVIAEGCIILAKKMERCIVGIRSRIGEGTEISNAIVMGNDRYETLDEIEANASKRRPNLGIGNNCHIRNAIIDKDVRMGNDVSIHGSVALQDVEEPTHCIRDGIIVIKKGAVLPDGTKIGLGA